MKGRVKGVERGRGSGESIGSRQKMEKEIEKRGGGDKRGREVSRSR